MANIVVFISSDFDSVQTQKIAEMLRIHQIQTTNDIQQATVILQPNDKPDIDTLKHDIIDTMIHEFKLLPSIALPATVFKTRKKTYNKNQAKLQFNKIQQRQKQFLINRTKHK